MRINNNIMAYSAQRNLGASAMSMGKSIEKLSSGLRINRAADDASGLVISQKLRAQTSGLRQATRNAQDGISVVQTAEGGLNEVHSMLNRMRDLAVQSANTGANDLAAREAAHEELDQLRQEINRIGATTTFGDTNLLDGSYGSTASTVSGYASDNTTITITDTVDDRFDIDLGDGTTLTVDVDASTYNSAQFASKLEQTIKAAALDAGGTAADLADSVSVNFENVGNGATFTVAVEGDDLLKAGTTTGWDALDFGSEVASTSSGGTFQVGANDGASNRIDVSISRINTDAAGLNLDGIDLADGDAADIATIDGAIEAVSEERGKLGSYQNRLESTISNLQVTSENLAASESRIRDVDVAAEMVNFTRSQILQQAGTAMLGQANQVPQSVLRLLG